MNVPKMIGGRLAWKVEKSWNHDTVLLVNYKTGERLIANKNQLFGFFYEDWDSQYIPTKVQGKRVLDIGAGWGETVFFYRRHGYEVTAAIECDVINLSCLRANCINHKWSVKVIDRTFHIGDLNDLRPLYDFIKMDIEGFESALLGLDSLPPMIFETHSKQVTAEFLKRFPDLKMKHRRKDTAILSNVG